jgi:hypothetical protein
MSFWYPSQEAFSDLTVTETEDGFTFSAPDDTECADWLGYYNSTEELQKEFTAEIINAIQAYINKLDNGNSQQDAEWIETDRAEAEIN